MDKKTQFQKSYLNSIMPNTFYSKSANNSLSDLHEKSSVVNAKNILFLFLI